MGKAGKTKRALKRKQEKRAQKEAQRARYQSYRDSGTNTKKKTNRKVSKTVNPYKHLISDCGNPGCMKCNPVNFEPFLKDGVPNGMPNWMFKLWEKV